MTNDPTAIILSRTPNPHVPGWDIVTVACPHCNRQHTHGVPTGLLLVEHRASHCITPGPGAGYYLQEDV